MQVADNNINKQQNLKFYSPLRIQYDSTLKKADQNVESCCIVEAVSRILLLVDVVIEHKHDHLFRVGAFNIAFKTIMYKHVRIYTDVYIETNSI
jgi:hypothetical protein